MRTNLIQSYLQNNSQIVQQYHADNIRKNFDVNKELSNRTFIKPLPSNGHLVRNSLFDLPSEIFKDIKYNAKAFSNSVRGKANDNELGHLNDLGMKLGGLAIASYLYLKKSAPLTKVMEFVGLASFFAAMDIWPKLALQLPAYLIHGFDIRQKYRDNYGIKKPVFQDHQFIPWDLYSDEEINKIGNRLKVPKDMKNRRDFIQEKMRKIALQNNTMWMLTAGFATPIMSALICEALQNPIHNYQDAKLNKKANSLLTNFNTEIKKYDFSAKNKSLESLLETHKGKTITPEVFNEIAANISQGMDSITAKAIKRDLKNIILQPGYDISKNTLDNFSPFFKDKLNDYSIKNADIILPNAQEILEQLDESKKALINSGEIIHGETEFSAYVQAFQKAVDNKISLLEKSGSDNSAESVELARNAIYAVIEDEELIKYFKSSPSSVLTKSAIDELKEINKTLNTLHARQRVLNKYSYFKSAQAQETYLANTWNSILDSDMLKTLGITDKDIKKTRMDSKLVNDLIREKIEDIVSDDVKYNHVMDKMIEKLNFLESRTGFAQYAKYNPDEKNPYKTFVDTAFDEASNELRNHKMKYTVQRLIGYDTNGSIDTHTLKDLQLSYVQDRVRGVKSSFYRLLNTLDFFKRVADLQHLDSVKEYNFKDANDNLIKKYEYPRVMQEEIVEMSKQLLLSGRSSDYAVKFFFLRDPELNPDNLTDEQRKLRFSDLEVKMGKVVNEFYGKKGVEQLLDNPHDRIFYDSAMRLMYGDRLSPKTKNKIENSTFFKNFEQYRQELLSYLGGDKYFTKKNHMVKDAKESTTEFRFQLLGSAIDDMFTKLFKQKFNSKTWLNMFGGFGVALLGVTVLSQFFMGKMPKDKIAKENK